MTSLWRKGWLIDFDLTALVSIVSIAVGFVVLPSLALIRHDPMAAAWRALIAMFLGCACLVVSKVSLFRRGVWFSWGSGRMTRGYAWLYRVGYGLMVLGVAYLLLTWKLTV